MDLLSAGDSGSRAESPTSRMTPGAARHLANAKAHADRGRRPDQPARRLESKPGQLVAIDAAPLRRLPESLRTALSCRPR